MAKANRKFQSAWTLKYGVIEKDTEVFCFLCLKVGIKKTENVKRHFKLIHGALLSLTSDDLKVHLETKLKHYHATVKQQSSSLKSYTDSANSLVLASLHVSHCIAKHGKPYSDGEYLKDAFLSASKHLFQNFTNYDKIQSQIKGIPLSNQTVKRRIDLIDKDRYQQLQSDLKGAKFISLCLDESNDVNSQARLTLVVRYSANNIMREELIKLVSLPGRTRGQDIFDIVLPELTNILDLSKIVSITTDGAPNMRGEQIGFVELLKKQISHEVLDFHCIIHQEALCAKGSCFLLDDVMATVTKIVNFIIARDLHKRQFSILLNEVESQYDSLLMYNHVRWLSRGKVLSRFVEALNEIRLFMSGKPESFPELTNWEWVNDVCFFADFTGHFNELNLKLQGKGHTVDSMFTSVSSFEKKLLVFKNDLNNHTFKYFPLLKKNLEETQIFMTENDSINDSVECFAVVIEYALDSFSSRFGEFKKYSNTFKFIRFPHKINFDDLYLVNLGWIGIDNLEMQLIDFQSNFVWVEKFKELNNKLEQIEHGDVNENTVENIILKVWNEIPSVFCDVKSLGLAIITIFGSSYICEQLFSSMNHIKSNIRNRLSNDSSASCLAVKSTNYEPRFNVIASGIQEQRSH